MRPAERELYDRLKLKLALLQKISTNTKYQIEFIHQRKMKGLLRLVDERGQYLQELAAMHPEPDKDIADNTSNTEIRDMLLKIKNKQQDILRDNNEALRAAKEEQQKIMADLRRVNSRKTLQNSYDRQWGSSSGSWLNQKG